MTKIFDLSVPIRNHSFDHSPQAVQYVSHQESARGFAKTWGINPEDLVPDPGIWAANENVSLGSHAGTHVDAPWHYGPTCGGQPSKTIDQVPLEWCYGDGVVLDFHEREPGYIITVADLEAELKRVGYALKAGDIPLIRSGAFEQIDTLQYYGGQCGLDFHSTSWLLDKGIRMIGIDAYSLDTSIPIMVERFKAGDKGSLWPAHFTLGRQREYIQCEKLGNLQALPRPHGFKVAMFPVKIEGASGAWTRAVAIFEDL